MTKAFMLVPFFASLHQLAYAHKIMGRSQIRRGNIVSRFPRRKKMSAANEQQSNNWWAEGDTPVHRDSRVTYLVDGRSAMLTMCRHFLRASKYIYLANWGITPTMELVRGKDQCAGPGGSPEQEELLAELRAESLQEAEINFWCTHDLTIQAVLGYMASKGVEVKVLIWDSAEFFSHCDPRES